SERSGHQHQVADEVGATVRAAAARGHAGLDHVAVTRLVQVGLPGDQAHVAAEGARAVQRALRPFQNLDAGEVDDARVERARHRGIVDVEAGSARGAEQVLPGDAANSYGTRIGDAGRTAAVAEGHVRGLGRVVIEALDVVVLERLGGEGGDAGG